VAFGKPSPRPEAAPAQKPPYRHPNHRHFRPRDDSSLSVKRSEALTHDYNMETLGAVIDDVNLQFARQLYEGCLERYGEDHQQTRLMLQYVASFEKAATGRNESRSPD
jgi:hypothetical protein